MWCKNCRQDTPGIRSDDKPGIRCGRCGGSQGQAPSSRPAGDARHPAEIGLDLGGSGSATMSYEDWELDQNVRSLEARLGAHRRRDSGPHFTPPASREPIYRFDAVHSRVPQPMGLGYQRRMRVDRPARRSSLIAQFAIWLGLITLTTGGGLYGWSVIAEDAAFARVGIPVAAAGVAVFLVGLVLLIERIWRNSRFAVQKLRQLDGQIRQLEQTTTMLGVAHGSPSQAFYSHLADGANPQMLLADLKGQIDMLAMNFARR